MTKRGVLVLLFLALQAWLVAAYVGAEHTVYFWDHAMYHAMARMLAVGGHESFAAAAAMFRQALGGDYNLIYALPSVAAFQLFGESRLVFILTNFFVFFVPYEIAVAAVLHRVYKTEWGVALLLSFLVALMIPPLWVPLLEGYPDNGAAACVVFALALLLGKSRSWRVAAGVGALLAFAILLRRHFAYPALTVIAVGGVWDFWRVRRTKGWERGYAGFWGLCGAVFVGVIGLIAPEFLEKAVGTNYGALYASYKSPVDVFLAYAFGAFGGLLIGAALAGAAWAARKRPETRPALGVVAGVTVGALAVWIAGPLYASGHYLLHVLPLAVAVGISGALVQIWPRSSCRHKEARWVATGALLCVLLGNSFYALAGAAQEGAGGVFSAARPPEVRKDYKALAALASYVEATTTTDDKILIVGSSGIFNQDIFRTLYVDHLQHPDMTQRFVMGPEIDGEQKPPLDVFTAANVYVVATPTQYHLDPAGQKVVTAAAWQFPPLRAADGLFHEDKETFALDKGVAVHVWRRDPWKPAALHAVLESIRAVAPPVQQDWVALTAGRIVAVDKDGADTTRVFTMASGLDLFFDRPLAAGSYRLGMAVRTQAGCLPHFGLTALSGAGREDKTLEFETVMDAQSVFQPFVVTAGERFVRLHATFARPVCMMELQGLRVEKR